MPSLTDDQDATARHTQEMSQDVGAGEAAAPAAVPAAAPAPPAAAAAAAAAAKPSVPRRVWNFYWGNYLPCMMIFVVFFGYLVPAPGAAQAVFLCLLGHVKPLFR
jgi:hypothetical protein